METKNLLTLYESGMRKEPYPNVFVPQPRRGFFGIGVEGPKTPENIGIVWRSARVMRADFMFIIGKRYRNARTDTTKSWKHIPLFEFDTFEHFHASLPKGASLVGVELDERSVPLMTFKHPQRAVYLLGAEDFGLSEEALAACDEIVQIPGEFPLNVAAAGTIVLYDRLLKNGNFVPVPLGK